MMHGAILMRDDTGYMLVCETCATTRYLDELDEPYDQDELQPGKCPGAGNHEGFVYMKDGRYICMGCYCAETEPPFWDVTVEPHHPTFWAHLAEPDDPTSVERKTVRVKSGHQLVFWPDFRIVDRRPVYEDPPI